MDLGWLEFRHKSCCTLDSLFRTNKWPIQLLELTYVSFFSLGADIIYDPQCVPHLIQVLSILLSANLNGRAFAHHGENQSNSTLHSDEEKEVPTAYIAQVIRNYETFHYFLKLAKEANLCVVDITETKRPQNLLPYMLSYDQSSVWLFRISSSRNCIVWGNHIFP